MSSESHADKELPNANNPLIRIFIVSHRWGYMPVDDVGLGSSEMSVEGRWKACTPESLTKMGGRGGFSAIGFRCHLRVLKFIHGAVSSAFLAEKMEECEH